ncbi:MAG: hypothetical protein RMM31_10490 [Anaerolineae bacterium]|nr:hypothetical protein [Anaerolineae bacterium]
MSGEIARVTLRVTQAFEQLQVPYAIVGSLASALHGVMRATLDVDIVADMTLAHLPPLVEALSAEFYTDDEMMREALEQRGNFNLIHYETAFKVDVFICKLRAFDRLELARRRRMTITSEPWTEAYVASAEDIVLSKLEWYRVGGETSERQWRDVVGVLKVCANILDSDYLHRWATELKVGDLLSRALREAGLSQ